MLARIIIAFLARFERPMIDKLAETRFMRRAAQLTYYVWLRMREKRGKALEDFQKRVEEKISKK